MIGRGVRWARWKLFDLRSRLAGWSSWSEVEAFCLFVGYGGSGHSVVGSLIDAHPSAVVSHELDALGRYFAGIHRERLFAEIFQAAQQQARRGRRSPRAGGGTYVQSIPGQRKRSPAGLTLLGDKKGARTTWQLARRGTHRLEHFEEFLGLPLRIIHVLRNPFDVVATGLAKGRGGGFPHAVPVVARLRERRRERGWIDLYHEELIARPRQQLGRLLAFLGLPEVEEHMDACVDHLFSSPRRRRHDVTWPPGLRNRVEELIERHDFLGRYAWDE